MYGKNAAVEVQFNISNGINELNLSAGIDPDATDGIDVALGEQELPPLPPSDVFEVRFVGTNIGLDLGNGSYSDYRQGTTPYSGNTTHEIFIQKGSGNNPIISWDLPAGITGKLEDFFGGIVVNQQIAGKGSYTIENPAITNLKLVLNYNSVTSVSADDNIPNEISLFQNYPNPFNPQTVIGFALLSSSDVTLKIYDITGRVIKTIIENKKLNKGVYEYSFDGQFLSSGTYLYRLEVNSDNKKGSFVQVKKMIFIK